MLFTGKTRSMPPKLIADDGKNVVIRPLCYAAESDIAAFAEAMRFPIIPCDLCGSQENLQRKRVKRLLSELEGEHPGVRASLLAATGNVMPAHPSGRSASLYGTGSGPLDRRGLRTTRSGAVASLTVACRKPPCQPTCLPRTAFACSSRQTGKRPEGGWGWRTRPAAGATAKSSFPSK